MKTTPDTPLTPEERALAALIAREGPHGEPSAALDSRILAAAQLDAAQRAAAREGSRKPRPRWPVAVGLAASVVLAVGIAWQLRPLQQAAPALGAPVADVPMTPPATVPDAASSSASIEQSAGEMANVDSAPSATPAPLPAPPAAPPMRKPSPVAAAPRTPQPRPVAQDSASQPASASQRGRNGYSPPAPSPPPQAPMVSAAPAEPSPSFVADAQGGDATARQQAAAATTRSANSAMAKQSISRDEARTAAAREVENRELQRVEVTGSRLTRTDLQVPVSEDARLAVEEWLERVRTRYGLGDADAARQSLLLFVKDHPEEPIPGDLEPLLDE